MSDLQASFEFQSEARVWIDLPGVETNLGKDVILKMGMRQVAVLYQMCDAALREYGAQVSDVLGVLPDGPVEELPRG